MPLVVGWSIRGDCGESPLEILWHSADTIRSNAIRYYHRYATIGTTIEHSLWLRLVRKAALSSLCVLAINLREYEGDCRRMVQFASESSRNLI